MIRIRLYGDRLFTSRLGGLADDLREPRDALIETQKVVARKASMLAAKRTGKMSRSNQTPPPAKKSARVVNRVRYSWYQEHGTKKMNAHPFMKPAAESTQPASIFGNWLDHQIRKHGL